MTYMEHGQSSMSKDESGPILITGISGQVGRELLRELRPTENVIAADRSMVDLCDASSVHRLIDDARPRWILNPAAYTAVDKAEQDEETAKAINADGPRLIGEAANRLRIPVIHFSTDYVFSGKGTRPWAEEDVTAPVNAYGRSKLAGETALAATGAPHLILRTSWVYSSEGNNFLTTILRLAGEREELRIVNDQVGSPTSARSLARMVAFVIHRLEAESHKDGIDLADAVARVGGVYHACDSGYATWFSFAQEFLRIAAEAHPHIPLARLVPIPTSQYPTPAQRPMNSRMTTAKLERTFGYAMPLWTTSTAEVMNSILFG